MKNLKEKQLTNTDGITLIALIITIIILIILAGVSLNAIFNQDGIFNRAELATQKYGKAKARETLEIALADAQMKKYTNGLTDAELDNKIAEIEGELLPKEKPNKNLQNVIIEGHIFEIDRSVPKIVDYIGPVDGIIITANIIGNDDWVKRGETVSLSGVIKTYSGGTITNSTATVTKGATTISEFPTEGGNYKIDSISEDTDIEITARDSNGKTNSKLISIKIKVDDIEPTVDEIKVEEELSNLTFKFSAVGTDNESGIKHFKYTITSLEDTTLSGIPTEKRTGIFTQEQVVEIQATKDYTYTINVVAIDNCDNMTPSLGIKTKEVLGGITIENAKKLVNKDTLKKYMGVKVRDYKPKAGGKWRIFYYDADNYFGDGIGTIYLKRDCDNLLKVNDSKYADYSASSTGISTMRKMNPKWNEYSIKNSNKIDSRGEKVVSYLCDTIKWSDYKMEGISSYAIGSPSVEIYMSAYNIWFENETKLVCKVNDNYGYTVGGNGEFTITTWNTNIYSTHNNSMDEFFGITNESIWLASPSSGNSDWVLALDPNYKCLRAIMNTTINVCPVVPLDIEN